MKINSRVLKEVMKESLMTAKKMFDEKKLKAYQTDVVQIAIALYNTKMNNMNEKELKELDEKTTKKAVMEAL